MTDSDSQEPSNNASIPEDGMGFPPASPWAWILLPVPAAACVLLTISLQAVFTHAGFFHFFLVATPFSFVFGLSIGTILSAYLVRSRWCYLLALIQLAAVLCAYLAVSRPGVELFPSDQPSGG